MAELLAAIDSLRRVWDESLALATGEEVEEAHKRSLRRHAIETGIIERLYDLDWGVTEALVAEGLTLDVAANEGGLTEDTLAVTAFAESVENHTEAESARAVSLLSPTPDDSVTLIYTDSADAR